MQATRYAYGNREFYVLPRGEDAPDFAWAVAQVQAISGVSVEFPFRLGDALAVCSRNGESIAIHDDPMADEISISWREGEIPCSLLMEVLQLLDQMLAELG